MSDVASAVLTLITQTIQNNQVDKLHRLLQLVPFEQMDANTADSFFSRYLDLTAYYNRPDCMKLIYEKWNLVYPPTEKISLFSMMVMMPSMSAFTLAYINKVLEEFSYLDVMYDLITYDSHPYLIAACEKTIQIFGEQPNMTYGLVMRISHDSPEIYEFISHEYRKTAEYAKIPSWMGDFRSRKESLNQDPYLPLESEVPLIDKEIESFVIPEMERIVYLLTEGMEGNEESEKGEPFAKLEETRHQLRQILAAATPAQKIEIVKPVMQLRFQEKMQNDIDLFRNSGPANPMIDSTGNDIDYRGCRMFTCTVFDYDEDLRRFVDWYEGYCHQCNLRIRRRWHAVRMPGETGGWIGSFCSWECVRVALDDVGYNPYGEPKTTQHLLVNLFQKQMMDLGIQDRVPDNPEIEAETSRVITSLLEEEL